MSHTVHPFSHRLGIIRDWKSKWFGNKKTYLDYLKSDVLVRGFLEKRLKGNFVSDIQIERNQKEFKIAIYTSRPGMIIGRSGELMDKLRKDLQSFMLKHGLTPTKQEIKIDVREVRSPDSDASIVAQMVGEGLERRLPFRRVVKQTIEKVMANRDVKGVKIELSGRLGGADMSRKEKLKRGQIPLQTFRADVDYAHHEALLSYGVIGIKVWIYKGEVFEKQS